MNPSMKTADKAVLYETCSHALFHQGCVQSLLPFNANSKEVTKPLGTRSLQHWNLFVVAS